MPTILCGCGEVHVGSALWIYREITCEKCTREFEMLVPEEGALAVVTRAESGAKVSAAPGFRAILMWKWQSELADTWGKRLRALACALVGPMLLHGL